MSDHPYESLSPEQVIVAVESLCYLCDARLLALNSYENRVYQVGIDDSEPLIAKFYRPDRWSIEQILEEHQFSQELADADISVVAPIIDTQGQSLHSYAGFNFALFKRRGGYPPELDNLDNLFVLGRTIGRIHSVAKRQKFQYRTMLDIPSFAVDSYQFIAEHFIPQSLHTAYCSLCEHLISGVEDRYKPGTNDLMRVHGDCHVGNILWRDEVAHFVDFDDCIRGPAVQDIWMLLSGDRQRQSLQLNKILEGYAEFSDFNAAQLKWIEPLRTMRIMHYSAWLAKRWSDPAFPKAFPWFNSERYWSEHILELREQLALIEEPPLELY